MKYNLTIREIDGNTNETIISFKNIFISSNLGLFGYNFKLQSKTRFDGSSTETNSKEDSVTLSFIPLGKRVYYTFDFKGTLLVMDSIKNKSNDFFKIDPSDNVTDPLFPIIKNVSEKYLFDTTINNTNLKIYKHPSVIKDSIGDMALQLFFIQDTGIKTPFNINGRYPLALNKYSLVGITYNLLSANRKFITLISDIRALTDAERVLCNEINTKTAF